VPGLRAIRNRTNNTAKHSTLRVPAGDTLYVSDEVAESLLTEAAFVELGDPAETSGAPVEVEISAAETLPKPRARTRKRG
jgi:hypothetical protein